MENRLTSLELSKKLWDAGCRLSTTWYWIRKYKDKDEFELYESYKLIADGIDIIPAYDLLWDICAEYAKEMFGIDGYLLRYDLAWCNACKEQIKRMTCTCHNNRNCYKNHKKEIKEIYIPRTFYEKEDTILSIIFYLLIDGKKQKAEDYIWKYCLFNKK